MSEESGSGGSEGTRSNLESTGEHSEGERQQARTVTDEAGDVYRIVPLLVDFELRDVIEIIVGACVLAIPVAFTEEVWVLGEQLPMLKVISVMALSMVFLALFAYFIFYHNNLSGHEWDWLKRIFSAYGITFIIAAILLFLLDKTPWLTDFPTAFKRVVLVTFPACFSATVVDSLK